MRNGALIGACIPAVLLVDAELGVFGTPRSDAAQWLRLFIAVALTGLSLQIAYRPRTVLRRFPLVVGGTCLTVGFAVGMIGLVAAFEDVPAMRAVVVCTVVTFVARGFLRLPLWIVTWACAAASGLTLVGVALARTEGVFACTVYLVAMNVAGWAMAAAIERRERTLFGLSRRLLDLGARLSASASASDRARAQQARRLSVADHDLRQSLAGLDIYLGLIEARASGWPTMETATAVDGMRNCVRAMDDHLQRLLVSESSGQVRPPDRERAPSSPGVQCGIVALRPMLQRLEAVYRPQAEQAGVRLRVRFPRHDLCLGHSNEALLWEALSNLVANALKYRRAAPGAWVLVRPRRRGNRVAVLVRDNGIGIDPADHSRIFEEGVRLPSGSTSAQGVGLGLSIVGEALEQLDGHVLRLRSQAARGACFEIWAPTDPGSLEDASVDSERGVSADTSTDPPVGARPQSLALQGRYALVVEPDLPGRAALVRALEAWGMLVDAVGSFDEAVRLAERAERLFDVVLADLGASQEPADGGLLGAVRDAQGCEMPAVLLSAKRSVCPLDVRNAHTAVSTSVEPPRCDRIAGACADDRDCAPLDLARLRSDLLASLAT